MPPITACKICDESEVTFSQWVPDVCDDCLRYDWGHWHWRTISLLGFAAGFVVTLVTWSALDLGARYAHPWALAAFAGMVGGLIGYALAAILTDRILNRMLVHSPPSPRPEDRAREAEKFFYISLLSAYQGKARFALRMLEQAQRHGWVRWDRLKTDPRLGYFTRLAPVRRITG